MSDHADGTRRIYRIDPAGLGVLRQWLDRFWDESLAAFKAEADPKPTRRPRNDPDDRARADPPLRPG